jgi:heme/copper-type cytochrome/quinol oxidase subunit 4
MKVAEYIIAFIVGIILTHILFTVADQVNPENINLNNVLELVVCFSYGLLLVLIYFDNRPKP